MISKKRKISQIPEIIKLSQTSKLLIVDNGYTAVISAGNIVSGISAISIDHINSTDNPHNVTKAQVGLGNVDNTSDLNKPISLAMLTALDSKQDLLVSGLNLKTINGQSLLGSGDLIFANAVNSVNGQVGVVSLTTDNIPEGAKKYFDNALVESYVNGNYAKLTTAYNDPSFINSLSFTKLTNKPNTLLGYGITDPIVVSSGTYANPSWITSLDWVKIINKPSFVATLDDLTDVQLSTLSVGEVLRWDGSKWANYSNIPVNQLAVLTDVSLTLPTTGDLLMYDAGLWKNVTQSSLISWGNISGDLIDQTDLQTALNNKADSSAFSDHITDTNNPHSVTKTQVGLSNVDNTSDLNKPISNATQLALAQQEILSIAYAIALG